MRNYLIIVFIFISSLILAQKTSFVEYNVTIANEDIFKNNTYLRILFDKAIIEAKQIHFGLICKNGNSLFYQMENLSKDTNDIKNTTLLFANYNGEIYHEKDTLYEYSNLLGKNTYLKKTAKINWTLKNENKIIDGYECYKATSEYVVINAKGEFRHPVVAWYCPKIAIPFGPNGYSGLPGLILELQVRNVTYGVEKIDFNSDKDFEIDKKTMKILNEEEYKKALDKFNDFDTK